MAAVTRTREDELGREMTSPDYLLFRTEQHPSARAGVVVDILDRAPDWQRVQFAFERATRLFPRLRQRVVEPAVPITSPRWSVDPDFDLPYHLRRVVVPSPGSLRDVLDIAQPLLMAPLDRARPLWEAILVEGLADGRAALVLKLSHAVTDGMGGVRVNEALFDNERDPADRSMPPMLIPEDVTPAELVRSALPRLPFRALARVGGAAAAGASQLARFARHPTQAASDVRAYIASLDRLVGPPPVEPSPLLRGRSLSRRFEVLEVPLESLRAAGKAAGGSLNDAYLAALGGMLRRYHEARGVPVEAVPAAIPISVRRRDDPAGGNRWAGARLALPVGEADPAVRIQQVRTTVLNVRNEAALLALDALAPILTRAPMVLLEQLTAIAAGIDIQASNFPSNTGAIYLAGARVGRQFVFGPLPGAAMMAVLVSQEATCCITVNYDPASVTHPDLFATCLREGFDEVLQLGSRGPARKAAGSARKGPTRAPAM